MQKTEKKEAPQWVQDAQKKIDERRKALSKEKFDSLSVLYNNKLGELMDLYFFNLTDDAEANKVAYDVLNDEWKALAVKVNATNGIIKLNHDVFEKNIADILNSDDYKARLKARQLEMEAASLADGASHEGVSEVATGVTPAGPSDSATVYNETVEVKPDTTIN